MPYLIKTAYYHEKIDVQWKEFKANDRIKNDRIKKERTPWQT